MSHRAPSLDPHASFVGFLRACPSAVSVTAPGPLLLLCPYPFGPERRRQASGRAAKKTVSSAPPAPSGSRRRDSGLIRVNPEKPDLGRSTRVESGKTIDGKIVDPGSGASVRYNRGLYTIIYRVSGYVQDGRRQRRQRRENSSGVYWLLLYVYNKVQGREAWWCAGVGVNGCSFVS